MFPQKTLENLYKIRQYLQVKSTPIVVTCQLRELLDT
jgi:hypothetical protein